MGSWVNNIFELIQDDETAISTNHKHSRHLMPMSRLQEVSPSVFFSFHVIVRTFWFLVIMAFYLKRVSKGHSLCCFSTLPLIFVQLYTFQNRNLFAILQSQSLFSKDLCGQIDPVGVRSRQNIVNAYIVKFCPHTQEDLQAILCHDFNRSWRDLQGALGSCYLTHNERERVYSCRRSYYVKSKS